MKLTLVLGMIALSAGPALAQGDVVAGEAKARACQACHTIGEEVRTKVGPHLNGTVGRPIAGLADYDYSAVLVEAGDAGMVWTTDNLRRYLRRPKKMFPGTKMTFYGIRDPQDVDNVIAYLASFAPDGTRVEPPR